MNGEIRKRICVAEEDKRLCQVIVCAAFLACIISIINFNLAVVNGRSNIFLFIIFTVSFLESFFALFFIVKRINWNHKSELLLGILSFVVLGGFCIFAFITVLKFMLVDQVISYGIAFLF